jgi:4-hydroxy-tetrahydrodipicolinate synthase
MPHVASVVVSSTCSATALQDTITHVRMNHPEKAILAGDDRLFGYSLYRGCHGALLGLGAILPAMQRAMVDAWFLGEASRFLDLSRCVDHLAEAIYYEPGDGQARRILSGLAHLGIIPEEASYDSSSSDSDEIGIALVRETIEALGKWDSVY